MNRRRLLSLAVAGVVAGGGLAACSSDKSNNNANVAKNNGAAATVLRIGNPGGPQQNNQNPFVYGSAAFNFGYRWALYEPLQMWNPVKPSEEPKPWLASAVEWAPDVKSVKITVRDGATWSDGKPLTAEDVAFTYDLVKKSPALNGYNTKYGTISSSGNTVTIQFLEPQYTRKNQLFSQIPIIPKHEWQSVKDPGNETNVKAVGSGPYTIKTFSPQAVVLTARTSGYWQNVPAVKELRYTAFTSNDSLTTALANGEIDWANVFIPNYKKVFIDRDPANHRVWAPPTLGLNALYLTTTTAPMDDKAVRKAMATVINRQVIFERASGGYNNPPVNNVTGLPTPAADQFIADQYKGQEYKADAASAKKILTDAGYKYDGDTLLGKDGKPVKLVLTDPAGFTDYQTALTLIADDLKKIGITASVDKANQDAWQKNVEQGRFDATMRWTNGGSTPFDLYQTFFEEPKKVGEPAFSNFGRYNDAAAQKALESYRVATTDAPRKVALDTLQGYFVDQVPAIAIGASASGGAYSTKNWTGYPDDANPYASGDPSYASLPLVLSTLKPAGAS